jgi:hypothetical protein
MKWMIVVVKLLKTIIATMEEKIIMGPKAKSSN